MNCKNFSGKGYGGLRRRLLAVLLVSLACSQAMAADAPVTLEGTNWQLVKLTVLGGFEFVPEEPGKYVLNFRNRNRLTGDSDCNSLSGTWQQQEDSTLHFEPLGSTRRLCEPGSLHNNLLLYLRDVQTFAVRDRHLILQTTTEGVEIEFESRD
jgi:heat shock protein HslJ